MEMNDITVEQLNLIQDVYDNHGFEYRQWAKEHGKPHIRKWMEEHGVESQIFRPDFAYYICSKFMEWKTSNI